MPVDLLCEGQGGRPSLPRWIDPLIERVCPHFKMATLEPVGPRALDFFAGNNFFFSTGYGSLRLVSDWFPLGLCRALEAWNRAM